MLISRRYFYLLAVLCVLLAACGKNTSEARKTVEEYIEAHKKKDFQTLYEINSVAQRKVALINRESGQNKEEGLKKNFDEYKALYDSIQGNEVSNAVLAEKAIFSPDSQYSIISIVVEEDKDSVTARFRERYIARAEIKISYPKKETAPVYNEQSVKEANFVTVFISGEDVVRGLQSTKGETRKWLFKNVNIKPDTAVFWPAS